VPVDFTVGGKLTQTVPRRNLVRLFQVTIILPSVHYRHHVRFLCRKPALPSTFRSTNTLPEPRSSLAIPYCWDDHHRLIPPIPRDLFHKVEVNHRPSNTADGVKVRVDIFLYRVQAAVNFGGSAALLGEHACRQYREALVSLLLLFPRLVEDPTNTHAFQCQYELRVICDVFPLCQLVLTLCFQTQPAWSFRVLEHCSARDFAVGRQARSNGSPRWRRPPFETHAFQFLDG
jgi:hypothetical protein